MDYYFKLKTIFNFYIPAIIFGLILLVIVGLFVYAWFHYVLFDKRKYKLLEEAGYKHEVRDVASCGDKTWYHWVKREPTRSSIRDEELDKMNYKALKVWINKESTNKVGD